MRVPLSLSSQYNLTKFEPFTQQFDYLYNLTEQYRYSAALYHGNYRSRKNFASASLIILDFDDDVTLSEAKEIFDYYLCLIVTTKSHQKTMKNGKPIEPRDKFRVIMVSNEVINDASLYETVMRNIVARFNSDPAATDAARFYEPNFEQEVWYSSGSSLFDISPYKTPISKVKPVVGKSGHAASCKATSAIEASMNADPVVNSDDGITLQTSEWLEHLEIGEQLSVHCPNPAHVDTNPSASIMKQTENTLTIYCFVCGALGRYPMFTDPSERK